MWRRRRRKLDERDLEDEIQAHLALEIQDRVRSGDTPEDAVRAARRAFGNVALVKDRTRDVWRRVWFESFIDDLRATWRLWARRPALPLLAVVTLALATGAAMTSFSVLDAIALKPLPVERPRELVDVSVTDPQGQPHSIAPTLLYELARSQPVFTRMCGFGGTGPILVTVDRTLVRANVEFASASYFDVLGAHAALGRLFDAADEGATPAATARIAVISAAFWRTRLNGDPNVLGRGLKVGDGTFTIVGVISPPFIGMQIETATEIVVPLMAMGDVIAGVGAPSYSDVIGRLRPGISISAADAALKAIWPRLIAATVPAPKDASAPQPIRIPAVRSVATGFSFLRSRYEHSMALLTALGAWMLLTACLSLAGLLVARVVTRLPELRIRVALGASRTDLVRGLFIETALLAIGGALAGAAGAGRLTPALIGQLWPATGLSVITAMDWRVVGASAGIAVGLGVLLGAAPAWLAARQAAAVGPRYERGIVSTGTRWAQALLVAQFAVSVVMLAGAGLFVGTFEHLARVDLGFNPAGLVITTAEPVAGGYRALDDVSYYHRLFDDLTAIPGVQNVSMLGYGLFAAPPPYASVATTAAQHGRGVLAVNDPVGPDFFRTLGVPLLRGRDFAWSDTPQMPPVAVLSSSLAMHLFPEGNAVGREVWNGSAPPFHIIGVAADAALFDARNPHGYVLYTSHVQRGDLEWPFLLIRTSGDHLEAAIRSRIAALGHEQVTEMRSANAVRDNVLARERLAAVLGAFFAALSMLLAVIAAYGLLAQTVARRTRELGLRVALGATPRDVMRLVTWQSVKLVLLGISLGLPIALMSAQLIAADVFGMPPRDPVVLVGAVLSLVVLALAAAYVPTRRALRLNPRDALSAQ
jgi:predicted permease